jgi:hypothetical protein
MRIHKDGTRNAKGLPLREAPKVQKGLALFLVRRSAFLFEQSVRRGGAPVQAGVKELQPLEGTSSSSKPGPVGAFPRSSAYFGAVVSLDVV